MHKAWRKPKLKIDVLGTPTQDFFSAFEFFLKLIVLVILITYLD